MSNIPITPRKSPRRQGRVICEDGPCFDLLNFTQDNVNEKPKSAHATPVSKEKGQQGSSSMASESVKRKGKDIIIEDNNFVEERIIVNPTKRTKVDHGAKKKKNKKSNNQKKKISMTKRSVFPTTHWCSYSNLDAIEKIKDKLSDQQLNIFKEGCFGYFLDMPKTLFQHQMIRTLMARELKNYSDDVFVVEVNGYKLYFGLREFGIVTGLNCLGEGEITFDPEAPNRLMSSYFHGLDKVDKYTLRTCFLDQSLLDDQDAVKLATLYFISEFLFSTEKDNTPVDKLHFDLVESGEYINYPWGQEVYKALLVTIRHRLSPTVTYYRLGGLPLALQVWIYECCSSIDGQIATRVGDNIPRILSWKAKKDRLRSKFLNNGMFRPNGNQFTNITATAEEIGTFRLPEVRDYEMEYKESNEDGYSDHVLEQPQEINSTEDIIKELNELRIELKKGRSDLLSFNEKIVREFESLKNFMTDLFQQVLAELKRLKAPVSKYVGNAHVEPGLDRRQDFVEKYSPFTFNITEEVQHMNKASNATQGNKQNEEAVHTEGEHQDRENIGSPITLTGFYNQQGVVLTESSSKSAHYDMLRSEVAKEKRPITLDDYELPPMTESQIVAIETEFLNKKTPELRGRVKLPGKHKRSPFIQEYMSDGSDNKIRRHVFETKHPFSEYIGVAINSDLIAEFNAWVDYGIDKNPNRRKAPYSKEDNHLSNSFDLGVTHVDKRDWFHNMARLGKPWNNQHIDVIMYYLRKKAKYGPNIPVRFTTTDCGFKTRMVQAYNHYILTENEVKRNDPVVQYIRGCRLHANVPWDEVDYVIFPCNIEKKSHWILIVFNIVERSLLVYDSYTCVGHNAVVCDVVKAFSIMIPIFLKLTGFYEKRNDIEIIDQLRVIMLADSLPQQKRDSLDCGVHVAVFAEYASMAQVTPKDDFKVEFHRTRYAALLWNYAKTKQELGAISESE